MKIFIGVKNDWFYVIDSTVVDGQVFYLCESFSFGDEDPCVIVDIKGNLIMENVYNGFDDLRNK